jgi:hypothetical protein
MNLMKKQLTKYAAVRDEDSQHGSTEKVVAKVLLADFYFA